MGGPSPDEDARGGRRADLWTDRHHDSAPVPWTLKDWGREVVMTGFHVVQLDADGRITRLTGFVDT